MRQRQNSDGLTKSAETILRILLPIITLAGAILTSSLSPVFAIPILVLIVLSVIWLLKWLRDILRRWTAEGTIEVSDTDLTLDDEIAEKQIEIEKLRKKKSKEDERFLREKKSEEAKRRLRERELAEAEANRLLREKELVESQAERLFLQKLTEENVEAKAEAKRLLREKKSAEAEAERLLREKKLAEAEAEKRLREKKSAEAEAERLLREKKLAEAEAEKRLREKKSAEAEAERLLREKKLADNNTEAESKSKTRYGESTTPADIPETQYPGEFKPLFEPGEELQLIDKDESDEGASQISHTTVESEPQYPDGFKSLFESDDAMGLQDSDENEKTTASSKSEFKSLEDEIETQD